MRKESAFSVRGGLTMRAGIDKLNYKPKDAAKTIDGITTELGIPLAVKLTW